MNSSSCRYIPNRYGEEFRQNYIIPMGAAIWSASTEQMEKFPVEYFVRFFKNHGMLSVDERPVWKVIKNGSKSYVTPLIKSFRENIKINSKVVSVKRGTDSVTVKFESAGSLQEMSFDQIVMAGHSDQTLRLLSDLSEKENEILRCFSYQPNSTVLHTDTSVLPQKQLAWAAWNYFIPKQQTKSVAVTYNMNILQGLQSPETFCVSLNMDEMIDSKKIIKKFVYDHPVYTQKSFAAQKRWSEISGKNRTHFCGAYWGYGFHEDGVNSALQVARTFNEVL